MNEMKDQLAEYQNRKQLLGHLNTEKYNIIHAIEKFYSQNTRHEAGAIQALEEMIQAFDRVLTAGDWESTLFLRNTVKPLKNMRTEAWELRERLLGRERPTDIQAPQLTAGMIRVYIAIFQYKAQNAKDWEAQLRSLPHYILGRPIYREELAVQQAVRAKLIQTSDAYVCVGIEEKAIQTGEFHPTQLDKQGNTLVQLAAGSVKSENILEFVYQDKRYYFVEGKLIEKTN
jgi:intracellular multiplication protein IcmQ